MAFEIVGPRNTALIEDADEQILWKLPRDFGLSTPQCDWIWEAFYRDPELESPAQVVQFRTEIEAIAAAHGAKERHELIRRRNIPAMDSSTVDLIVAPMLAADPVLTKCKEVISVCNEAIDAGQGLICRSD